MPDYIIIAYDGPIYTEIHSKETQDCIQLYHGKAKDPDTAFENLKKERPELNFDELCMECYECTKKKPY